MKKFLPIGVAVVIIAVATFVHAYYAERFTPRVTATLNEFAKRLPNVPMTIGPWEGVEDELNPEEFKATHCPVAFQRTYRHRDTGERVAVYLVVGSGKNITIHSPDWCYAAKGYTQVGSESAYEIPVSGLPKPAEFSTSFFRHPAETEARTNARGLRILWTYSKDGVWRGPKYATVRYTLMSALFKMYVMAEATEGRSNITDTAIPKFVKTALPVINEVLFPPNQDS